MSVTVFAPGSIGNVGPGFDVLGLAVDGIGDRVTIALDEHADTLDVRGRDAHLLPREPAKNAASIAAAAWMRAHGGERRFRMSVEKGLPFSGGMGGSAASSVAGALAAALALGDPAVPEEIMCAALEGEGAVAGRHLDNIAPAVLGGLTLVRSVDPLDVLALPAPAWWLALVTPDVRIETRAARALLPTAWERAGWVQQMANTAALVHAFATGDGALVGRSLDDGYAEPRRATLIPHFAAVKAAAMDKGALGCSISGAGPTVFAVAADREVAQRCAAAMQSAFAPVAAVTHVGAIAMQGARRVEEA
jgi:homoserine kinase